MTGAVGEVRCRSAPVLIIVIICDDILDQPTSAVNISGARGRCARCVLADQIPAVIHVVSRHPVNRAAHLTVEPVIGECLCHSIFRHGSQPTLRVVIRCRTVKPDVQVTL